MTEKYYYWNCSNPECECKNNRVSKRTVTYAIERNKRVGIYCAICGFAPLSSKLDLHNYDGTAAQTCICVPFTGETCNLPIARTIGGLYANCNGVEYGLLYFLNLGIQPDRYLRWVEHGKRPNHLNLLNYYHGNEPPIKPPDQSPDQFPDQSLDK